MAGRNDGKARLGDLDALVELQRRVNREVHERYRKCANTRAYRARLKARADQDEQGRKLRAGDPEAWAQVEARA